MKVEVKAVRIAQTRDSYQTRYFVDVRFKGDGVIYDAGNFAHLGGAEKRRAEVYAGEYPISRTATASRPGST